MLKRNSPHFYLLSVSFLGLFRKQRIACHRLTAAMVGRTLIGLDLRSSCALLINVGLAEANTNTVVCPGMYPALNAMENLGGKWKELP